jgi:hypothetical protein
MPEWSAEDDATPDELLKKMVGYFDQMVKPPTFTMPLMTAGQLFDEIERVLSSAEALGWSEVVATAHQLREQIVSAMRGSP